jgi:hypothetical protein
MFSCFGSEGGESVRSQQIRRGGVFAVCGELDDALGGLLGGQGRLEAPQGGREVDPGVSGVCRGDLGAAFGRGGQFGQDRDEADAELLALRLGAGRGGNELDGVFRSGEPGAQRRAAQRDA